MPEPQDAADTDETLRGDLLALDTKVDRESSTAVRSSFRAASIGRWFAGTAIGGRLALRSLCRPFGRMVVAVIAGAE